MHTGQHYDDNMSGVFFRELDIPEPDRHLGVGSGSHGRQTGAMLERIEVVLEEVKPDAVIVYGDTNSTLAGALAAAKLRIPVAHIEAGLRSFNRAMPEEINRIATDHLSRWLFAPSEVATRQLAVEGICDGVHNVGDIMADSVRLFRRRAEERSDILQRLALQPGAYCVATVHRAANTDSRENLQGILQGLGRIQWPVVFPCHPRTKAAIHRHGLAGLVGWPSVSTAAAPRNAQPRIIDPLGYLDMLQLQQHARVILTDSGGMQKEAYYLGVPVVTLRKETEWTETVDVGCNRLVGPSSWAIAAAVEEFLAELPQSRPQLYGDGQTAGRIVEVLAKAGTS